MFFILHRCAPASTSVQALTTLCRLVVLPMMFGLTIGLQCGPSMNSPAFCRSERSEESNYKMRCFAVAQHDKRKAGLPVFDLSKDNRTELL